MQLLILSLTDAFTDASQFNPDRKWAEQHISQCSQSGKVYNFVNLHYHICLSHRHYLIWYLSFKSRECIDLFHRRVSFRDKIDISYAFWNLQCDRDHSLVWCSFKCPIGRMKLSGEVNLKEVTLSLEFAWIGIHFLYQIMIESISNPYLCSVILTRSEIKFWNPKMCKNGNELS